LRLLSALRDNRKEAEHEIELQRRKKTTQDWAQVLTLGGFSTIEWLLERRKTKPRG
jgi:hypothetical protein